MLHHILFTFRVRIYTMCNWRYLSTQIRLHCAIHDCVLIWIVEKSIPSVHIVASHFPQIPVRFVCIRLPFLRNLFYKCVFVCLFFRLDYGNHFDSGPEKIEYCVRVGREPFMEFLGRLNMWINCVSNRSVFIYMKLWVLK